MVNIAINGFGRIGRQAFEAALDREECNVVAINDLTDTKTLAHLLKYDSVHREYGGEVSYDEKHLIVDGNKIPVFAERDPEKLPWKKLKVDCVIECTGHFTNSTGAQKHVKAGAKRVLISAPFKIKEKNDKKIKTICCGVNDDTYKGEDIVSNGSCTTNCFAVLCKVLEDKFGIKKAFMLTTHAYTGSQNLVDGSHKDLRRARAAAVNIIPTSTGAAKAVAEVIPSLKGKLHAQACRVPVPCGSIAYGTIELGKKATEKQVNDAFKKAAKEHLRGILEYSEEELVSSDIVGNPHSAIYDSKLTMVDDKTVFIAGWYDNEWGYSNRLVDALGVLMRK